MKQLIVILAIQPFLIFFILQYTLEQKNHYNINQFQSLVYSAKEQAKQDGYFTSQNINNLKNEIATQFDIPENQIIIDATQVPKYRINDFNQCELIHYRVSVPIEKLIAANRMWGISDGENKKMYTIDNYAASELLQP